MMQGMKTRKRKTQDPCQGCFLHKDRCICDQFPTLSLRTKVTLIIHAKELKRTTNTGRLAMRILTNSEMRVRGEGRESLDLSDLLVQEYRTLLFYPSPGAVELTREFVEASPLPIQLIVPDGNWRQASKVHYRHHELEGIPRVMISTPNLSEKHLRAETTESGMATLEAIATALGITEGSEAKEAVMKFYQLKLEGTLSGRNVVND